MTKSARIIEAKRAAVARFEEYGAIWKPLDLLLAYDLELAARGVKLTNAAGMAKERTT